MTAKRGMQWKTPWRRQKASLGAQAVGMWWFHNDEKVLGVNFFRFQQALTTPAIGDVAPPFWCGAIMAVPVRAVVDVADSAVVNRSSSWTTQVLHQGFSPEFLVRAGVAPVVEATFDPLSSPFSPTALRAVVVMLVVEPVLGGDFIQTLWVDGAPRGQIKVKGPYVPGAGVLFVAPVTAYLNSMAGGNALPTTEEIQTWFSASRYASPMPVAQQIPGKTLDQYDAGATPGVVPDPLVNLATGQNAPLVLDGTPNPANLLLPATFAY